MNDLTLSPVPVRLAWALSGVGYPAPFLVAGVIVGGPYGVALSLAAAPLLLAAVWRGWRIAVVADAHGVTVRNRWRTSSSEWTQVRCLRVTQPWWMSFVPYVTTVEMLGIVNHGRHLAFPMLATIGSTFEDARGKPLRQLALDRGVVLEAP